MNCAVTVCDADGVILYMNDKAKETFASHGDLVGKNLMGCHSDRSKEIACSKPAAPMPIPLKRKDSGR